MRLSTKYTNQERRFRILEFTDVKAADARLRQTMAIRFRRKTTISTPTSRAGFVGDSWLHIKGSRANHQRDQGSLLIPPPQQARNSRQEFRNRDQFVCRDVRLHELQNCLNFLVKKKLPCHIRHINLLLNLCEVHSRLLDTITSSL